MNRRQRLLGTIALFGWLLAALAQLLTLRAVDNDIRSTWTLRRNQCLLVSSICANTLVASLIYELVKRVR